MRESRFDGYLCRRDLRQRRIENEHLYDLAADPEECSSIDAPKKVVTACRRGIHRRLGHEEAVNAIVKGADQIVEGRQT